MTFTELIDNLARFIHKTNNVDISQRCGLAEGTNSTTLKTQSDIVYFLGNNQLEKAATDNITMTACAAQAESLSIYYLVSINSSGTITITKGTATALPSTPSGQVAIGAFKITTAAGYTFTSGTTDLSATGITSTFYDIDCGVAPVLINNAMRGMERKFNFRGMKRRTSYSLAEDADAAFNNPFPLYKSYISGYGTNGTGVRYPINKDDIEAVELAFASTEEGPPQLIAEVPASDDTLTPDSDPALQLRVKPKADAAYTLTLTAYCYHPFLENVFYTSNWWTIYHSDVLLYASLVEAEPYLKEDDRLEVWKTQFNEKLIDLVNTETEEKYSGSTKYNKADE